ncbi:DUF2787 family protein [Marinobacterium iners]|uniref:DUF2787 family protein n=1 Tax=Marinobacterium iners TaxID=48076 RepID=UPI003BF59BE8
MHSSLFRYPSCSNSYASSAVKLFRPCDITAFAVPAPRQACTGAGPLQEASAITFNFRDPHYSADRAVYHPAEIRLSRSGIPFRHSN